MHYCDLYAIIVRVLHVIVKFALVVSLLLVPMSAF